MPLIAPELKALLICPACKGELDEDEARSVLRCRNCRHEFPVREFPVMLLEIPEENFAATAESLPAA